MEKKAHAQTQSTADVRMKVTLIPAFNDNYFFSIEENSAAMIVDPGSAKEVLAHLETRQLKLEVILCTHHHGDHIGGVAELQKKTGAKLYGASTLPRFGLTPDLVLKGGDRFKFHSLEFETIAVPGHTLDHLAYYEPREHALFCGDTLFSLGCGRLFEGTFEMMYASLARLKALPDDTRVYCAHEYTLTNMRFSKSYLLENGVDKAKLKEYADLEQDLRVKRDRGEPTVPSTIAREKHFNLFLNAPSLAEFTRVREARNTF